MLFHFIVILSRIVKGPHHILKNFLNEVQMRIRQRWNEIAMES